MNLNCKHKYVLGLNTKIKRFRIFLYFIGFIYSHVEYSCSAVAKPSLSLFSASPPGSCTLCTGYSYTKFAIANTLILKLVEEVGNNCRIICILK